MGQETSPMSHSSPLLQRLPVGKCHLPADDAVGSCGTMRHEVETQLSIWGWLLLVTCDLARGAAFAEQTITYVDDARTGTDMHGSPVPETALLWLSSSIFQHQIAMNNA